MPIYRVRGSRRIPFECTVNAANADEAVDLAAEEATVPHMGEGWDSSGADDFEPDDGGVIKIDEGNFDPDAEENYIE